MELLCCAGIVDHLAGENERRCVEHALGRTIASHFLEAGAVQFVVNLGDALDVDHAATEHLHDRVVGQLHGEDLGAVHVELPLLCFPCVGQGLDGFRDETREIALGVRRVPSSD